MKINSITIAVLICGVLLTGCVSNNEQASEISGNAKDYINGTVDGLKAQAAEEMKKAFANEVIEFFKSDDLSKSLGLDSDEQQKLEESVKQYIDNYDLDEEKLKELKASVEEVLQNSKGLSKTELQDKITAIFQP
jgi:outer membrane murein-binding lipoprotein Lpp